MVRLGRSPGRGSVLHVYVQAGKVLQPQKVPLRPDRRRSTPPRHPGQGVATGRDPTPRTRPSWMSSVANLSWPHLVTTRVEGLQ